jgi:hypothetical protein
VPEDCVDQVEPPLLVVMIVPLLPTAQQWLVSGQEIPRRAWLLPLVWLDQVAPPLLVATMPPLFRATQHALDEAQLTAFPCCDVPG